MNIKRGNVVSHTGAIMWGVGKVLEVNALRVTIQFSDGVVRKISSSHYTTLKPADPAAFVPVAEIAPLASKARLAPKKPRSKTPKQVEQ